MKKSYSSHNVLQERLSGLSEARGFFKHIFSQRRILTVTMPYIDYLRGVVFCDDLRDNFGDEVPFQFDMSLLVYLLFNDMLTQIKKGGAKNDQIATYLVAGKHKHFPTQVQEKRVLKPLTQHVFQFETVEEEVVIAKPSQEDKKAYLDIRMKETEVLRGEILLSDLEPFLHGIELSIEEVIAIVYLDFIENIKKEGNSTKVQKSILAHLKRF